MTGALAGKAVAAIAAGADCSAVLTTDGKVFAVGRNTDGDLGLGNRIQPTGFSPVLDTGVLSGKTIQSLAVFRGDNQAENTTTALPAGAGLFGWGNNGRAQLGDGTTTDRFSPVALALTGSYASVQFNGLGNSIAYDTSKPSFTLPPQPVTVNEGSLFTLQTAVHAPGQRLSYQWMQETALNSGTYAAIAGGTSSILSAGTATAASAGRYLVEVTSPAGTFQSAPATVTVRLKPVLTITPLNPLAIGGARTTFTVSATGASPFTYQWRKNGTAISGATAATYTIASTQPADAANYDVVVSNVAGTTTSAPTTLTVTVPVTITAHPVGLAVNPSAAATFSVTATGTAPLTYQWRKGGAPIAGGTGTSLSIPSVQPTDVGSYDVVVTNGAGPVTSNAAVLSLNTPLSITKQPASLTLNPGTLATFGVTATGTTPITYQWRKNGSAIAGGTAATLTIASVQASDAANYDVVLTNVVGSLTSGTAALSVNTPVTITTQPSDSGGQSERSPATFSVVAAGTAPLSYQWRKNGSRDHGRQRGDLHTPLGWERSTSGRIRWW
jgi:hypothetical protein